ncbi:nematocyst expressed protein 6-like [Nematostella vectensis]|uniref:nematocyst expressed protein 6-like n=1 Tax=Nematostella vectensis TaxID=45351 RepID=UPI0020776B37|nr:nematocyst expressed protein 6-like [Nematostella vectensis]
MKGFIFAGVLVSALICLAEGKPFDNLELVEDDMLMTKEQKEAYLAHQNGRVRRAALKNRYLWPQGKIPFTFSNDIDQAGRELAERAMNHWMSRTCLRFSPRRREHAYIEFQYDGKCRARVGYTGEARQKVSIGSTRNPCSFGSVVHELGHGIGFFHEHSRPDRDEYVNIHFKNIRKGAESNFRKDNGYFVDSRGQDYDYGSIMHYSKYQGNNALNAVVMEPIQRGAEIGQRDGLSAGDIRQTKLMYKCNAQGDSELQPVNDEDEDGGDSKKKPDPKGPKPGEIEE